MRDRLETRFIASLGGHGSTVRNGASLLMVFAPMPPTACSCSSVAKGPLCSRCATMRAASFAETPGTCESSRTSARLTLSLWPTSTARAPAGFPRPSHRRRPFSARAGLAHAEGRRPARGMRHKTPMPDRLNAKTSNAAAWLRVVNKKNRPYVHNTPLPLVIPRKSRSRIDPNFLTRIGTSRRSDPGIQLLQFA